MGDFRALSVRIRTYHNFVAAVALITQWDTGELVEGEIRAAFGAADRRIQEEER
jgi:hypothetical protein